MNTYAKILEAIRHYDIEKAIAMLEANIREESAKKSGTRSIQKVIESMIKHADTNAQPRFAECHVENGKYFFLDGHRAFRTDSNLGYREAEEGARFKGLDRFFDNANCNDVLTFSKQDLQTFIKIDGIKRNRPGNPFLILSQNGNVYGFNPFFLLDYIDFTGKGEAIASRPNAPIMDENKTALVLPVNVRGVTIEQYYNFRNRVFGDAIPTVEKTA